MATQPPRQVLLQRLAAKFKTAGERLKPEYALMNEGDDPQDWKSNIKLYGPSTPVDEV